MTTEWSNDTWARGLLGYQSCFGRQITSLFAYAIPIPLHFKFVPFCYLQVLPNWIWDFKRTNHRPYIWTYPHCVCMWTKPKYRRKILVENDNSCFSKNYARKINTMHFRSYYSLKVHLWALEHMQTPSIQLEQVA